MEKGEHRKGDQMVQTRGRSAIYLQVASRERGALGAMELRGGKVFI
jgi:hypothetical protein